MPWEKLSVNVLPADMAYLEQLRQRWRLDKLSPVVRRLLADARAADSVPYVAAAGERAQGLGSPSIADLWQLESETLDESSTDT